MLVNERHYDSHKENDLLIACRNLLHEIIHVHSDFFDLGKKNDFKIENIFCIILHRSKNEIPKAFAKQGISLSNALKYQPIGHVLKKHTEMLVTSSFGYIHFESLLSDNHYFLEFFKKVFNIAEKCNLFTVLKNIFEDFNFIFNRGHIDNVCKNEKEKTLINSISFEYEKSVNILLDYVNKFKELECLESINLNLVGNMVSSTFLENPENLEI